MTKDDIDDAGEWLKATLDELERNTNEANFKKVISVLAYIKGLAEETLRKDV